MRLVAVLVGMTLVTPACAGAQVLDAARTSDLSAVAFVGSAQPPPAQPAIPIRSGVAALAGGDVFAAPDFPGQSLSGQPAVTARVAAAGQGLIEWRSSEISRLAGDGSVDTVRLSMASISRTPLIGPNVAYDPDAVNVSFRRGWPGAVMLRAGAVGVNVTPHAGFGFGPSGASSAEAGAMIKVSSARGAIQDRLEAMGIKDGLDVYGDKGRFYLFAAVQGQAVGLNMQEAGGVLRRMGWTTDAASAMIGDGQVGVGWRKGGVEASFGYVHRGIHVKDAPFGASDSYADDMAALAFTYHPHW